MHKDQAVSDKAFSVFESIHGQELTLIERIEQNTSL
jgi:hypothetical protein